MSEISKLKCDGPDCESIRNLLAFGQPLPWYKVTLEGVAYDFCCAKCLRNWIKDEN